MAEASYLGYGRTWTTRPWVGGQRSKSLVNNPQIKKRCNPAIYSPRVFPFW
jgi:hypothetical protein